jgi:DNA replication and repair protein RecF
MEEVQIKYSSPLFNASFADLLIQQREKDVFMQRTTVGIHKDDLHFQNNDISFKNIASQGQKKSLLFALKIAEYEWIKTWKGFPPLLLLDDVFEKLDQQRMNNLLNRVCIVNKGQVFITDTHEERLKSIFDNLDISYQIINL